MSKNNKLKPLKNILSKLRKDKKILLAYLFGSYANNSYHKKSDIDLALFINADNEIERTNILDQIFMSVELTIEPLMLDDEDESPFIVQEAIKGIPLVDPETDTLYKVCTRVLHETESIRFRRRYEEYKSK